MEKKKSLWFIILGALIAFTNGWEVFSGNASTKDWAFFIGGLLMLVLGLLLCFGNIKDDAQTTPREEYAHYVGICFGWGFCAIFGWLSTDCVFDSHTIVNLIIWAFFIVTTIIRKHKLPKGE